MKEINSSEYWDNRFESDWEEKFGLEQTLFFTKIALNNIPNDIKKIFNKYNFSILDWGCAEGQGAHLLKKEFNELNVSGMDFSEVAIKKAKKLFNNIVFYNQNLKDLGKEFDVIYSSNCLEHFEKPGEIMKDLYQYTNNYLILLLPFEEKDRIDEHFVSFDYDSFKIYDNDFHLVFFKEINIDYMEGVKYWSGKQILLIYAKSNAKGLDEYNVTLKDSFSDINKNIKLKELKIINLENQIDILNNKIKIINNNFNQKEQEIQWMKSSKFWKIKTFYEKFKHPIFFLKKVIRKVYNYIIIIFNFIKKYLFNFIEAEILIRKIPNSFFENQHGGKNIVFQLDSFDKGGLEEVVFSLAKNIQANENINLYIFVNDNELGYFGKKIQDLGIKIILLKKNKFFLKKLLKKLKIDLINLHYSIFGSDLYIEQGIPIVYTIHNSYIWADKKFIEERKPLYDKFTMFIAVSDQVRDFFCKKFSIEESSISVIPNGLDLDNLKITTNENRKSYSLLENDFIFINIASFNWNKFHILMIRAIELMKNKYPNMKLLFVGNPLDQNVYNYVVDEIKKRKLEENIKIIEYVPKEKVLGLLKMSDCYLMPSLIEGWSIAIMEAMYCELPLILSDIGSAKNVIENNDIGLIIKNPYNKIQEINPEIFNHLFTNDQHLNNIEDLCIAMENMYLNKNIWKTKGKLGKNKIETTFNIEKMVNNYIYEYHKILNK